MILLQILNGSVTVTVHLSKVLVDILQNINWAKFFWNNLIKALSNWKRCQLQDLENFEVLHVNGFNYLDA